MGSASSRSLADDDAQVDVGAPEGLFVVAGVERRHEIEDGADGPVIVPVYMIGTGPRKRAWAASGRRRSKARGGEAGRAAGYMEKIIGETTALRASSTKVVVWVPGEDHVASARCERRDDRVHRSGPWHLRQRLPCRLCAGQ
jgi:hypothetical protein